jgi:hypothetical protein
MFFANTAGAVFFASSYEVVAEQKSAKNKALEHVFNFKIFAQMEKNFPPALYTEGGYSGFSCFR